MANNFQLRRIHLLLIENGIQEQKSALVFSFSTGRCSSSKELTYTEAQNLIQYLEGQYPLMDNGKSVHHNSENQMRRKLISICHNMKWKLETGKADIGKLDEWCRNKSYLKKPLMKYECNELPKLVSQLRQVYISFINKNNNV